MSFLLQAAIYIGLPWPFGWRDISISNLHCRGLCNSRTNLRRCKWRI